MMKIKFSVLIFFLSLSCFSQIKIKQKGTDVPKFFVMFGGGPSYRIGKIPDGLTSYEQKYIKELKSGADYDIGIYYQKNYISGFGLKYNSFRSKNNGFSGDYGNFGDDVRISFYGASFFITEDVNARIGEGFMELGLGYIYYKNDSYMNTTDKFLFSGGNLGLSASFAYHFRINKSILIGPQVSFVGGVLNKMKIVYPDGTKETVTLKNEEKENLYRFDFNVSAKIRI